jgi:hypothetical protein
MPERFLFSNLSVLCGSSLSMVVDDATHLDLVRNGESRSEISMKTTAETQLLVKGLLPKS